jgi:hypothetical protein
MVGWVYPGELSHVLWLIVDIRLASSSRHLDAAQDLAGILLFLASPVGARITGARIESEAIGAQSLTRWWGRRSASISNI